MTNALCLRAIAFVVLASMECIAHSALFANASFETVPGMAFGQGLLPSNWLDSTNTFPGADTYSMDDTYGLTVGSFNHFNSPFAAYDGNRWLAGGAFPTGEREGISQLLPITLVPGQQYEFKAAVTYTTLFGGTPPAAGGWELMLSPDTTFTNAGAVSLGLLPATMLDVWQLRSITFNAPPNANALPYLLLVPYTATPGQLAYSGIDGPLSIAVPEPAALFLALSALLFTGRSVRRR